MLISCHCVVLSSLCCSVVIVLCCYLCCSVIIVLFYVLIVCTVTLPPGVNPFAVDKYIKIDHVYLIYKGVKLRTRGRLACFIVSPSLQHPNTHFDHISILYLPLFKPAAKKTIPR